jgi:signal transduction histidine kinase
VTHEVDLDELRAPVRSMLAYIDFLLEGESGEQETRRFLEVIRGSAARLEQLVAERER